MNITMASAASVASAPAQMPSGNPSVTSSPSRSQATGAGADASPVPANAPAAGATAAGSAMAGPTVAAARFFDVLRSAASSSAVPDLATSAEPTGAAPGAHAGKPGDDTTAHTAAQAATHTAADEATADDILAEQPLPGMAMPMVIPMPVIMSAPLAAAVPAQASVLAALAAAANSAGSTARSGRSTSTGDAGGNAATTRPDASGDSAGSSPSTMAARSVAAKAPDASAVPAANGAASAPISWRAASDDVEAASKSSARPAPAADAPVAVPRDRAPASVAIAAASPSPAPWGTSVGTTIGDPLPAVTVKLPPDAPAQWRQPLTEALGDRLQVQMSRGSEQALIRLDPPMLGRIDISIRHEAGALMVHLSASNGEVLRQLHGIGDNLRQDLSQRQQGDVTVSVSGSGDASREAARDMARDGGQQRQRARDPQAEEKTPGRALAEADAGHAPGRFAFVPGSDPT